MTVMSTAQTILLEDLFACNTKLKEMVSSETAKIRALVAEVTALANAERDVLIRAAFVAGIPKRQIGILGLGTSSPSTVAESLARTDAAGPVPRLLAASLGAGTGNRNDPTAYNPFAPEPDRYTSTGPGTFRVQLRDRTLNAACKAGDWDVAQVVELGFDSASFKLDTAPNGNRFVSTITADFMPEHGQRHPVVQWLRVPDNAAEALAWAVAA